MELKLSEKKKVTTDIVTFVWKSAKPVSWQPGQYMHYVLDHKNPDERGKERWFTISAAPYEKNVSITTKIKKEGGSSFKSALNQLKIGDSIEADGPKGKFIIEDPEKFHVFIAGGIGITPFRSMYLQTQYDKQKLIGVLLYANKNKDIAFKKELEQTAHNIDLDIKYFVGSIKIDADAILESIPTFVKPLFYVSGPEPMVEYYEKILLGLGFADNQIKRDFFPGYGWPIA